MTRKVDAVEQTKIFKKKSLRNLAPNVIQECVKYRRPETIITVYFCFIYVRCNNRRSFVIMRKFELEFFLLFFQLSQTISCDDDSSMQFMNFYSMNDLTFTNRRE